MKCTLLVESWISDKIRDAISARLPRTELSAIV